MCKFIAYNTLKLAMIQSYKLDEAIYDMYNIAYTPNWRINFITSLFFDVLQNSEIQYLCLQVSK